MSTKPPSIDEEYLAQEKAPFHPDYDYDDGDLILQSSDNVRFHVHSLTLKLFSSVFKDMLAMPKGEVTSTTPLDNVIPLDEPADVLRILLDNMYPRHGLPGDVTLKLLNAALVAAIKYDIPCTETFFRSCLLTSKDGDLSSCHPIQRYGVAWNLGLTDEAKLLSTETLRCDINSEEVRRHLEGIDGNGALKLQRLHQDRKAIMFNVLNKTANRIAPYKLTTESSRERWRNYKITEFLVPQQVVNHASHHTAGYHWLRFMLEVSEIMDKCPDGSLFWENDADFFLQDKCSGVMAYINWRFLIKEFRHILNCMPKEIDV